jgi:hypothetical protein
MYYCQFMINLLTKKPNATRERHTSISNSVFVRIAALTTLQALAESILSPCPISKEDLGQWLDEWGVDTKLRLALVTWHFDASMLPPCTIEMVRLVSAFHDDPQSVEETTKTIHEGSKYSHHGTHEEKHEVFVSTLRGVLVSSKTLEIPWSLTRARKGAGNASSTTLLWLRK